MVSNLDSKNYYVKHFNNFDDYLNCKDSVFDEEIIEIDNFSDDDIFNSKTEGFLYIPNYIQYMRRSASFDEILSEMSKNKIKKIKKGKKEIERFKILIEENLTKNSFEDFYKLYLKRVDEKENGIVSCRENWFEIDIEKSKKIGIFVYDCEKLIAGIVARSFNAGEILPRRMSISYSALDSEYRNLGINDYLNVLMIDLVNKLGFEYVFRGMDTNLYGKHLNVGIPVFKRSFGYKIVENKLKPRVLIKFNNLENFSDEIKFFSFDESENLVENIIENEKKIKYVNYE